MRRGPELDGLGFPAFMVDGVRISRTEWMTRTWGEEIAEIADRGPYQVGLDIRSDDVLSVFSGTAWPGKLNDEPWPDVLDKVFPFTRQDGRLSPWTVGQFSPFLGRSRLVQSDIESASQAIADQYNELRDKYIKKENVGDLRAIRDEANMVSDAYRLEVDKYLRRFRRIVAVLYLEALRASGVDFETGEFPYEQRKAKRGADSRYITYFWDSALHGGPSHIETAESLSAWLAVDGVHRELLDFQSKWLFDEMQARDKEVSKALPVEYRRVASQILLWKLAHGQPVEEWTNEDSEALKSGVGNPDFISNATPDDIQLLIVEKFVELIAHDRDKYAADPRKGKVSDAAKSDIVDWLHEEKGIDLSEETVRKYATRYLDSEGE